MITDEIWTAIFIRIIYILCASNVYITAITKEDLIFDSVLRTITGDEIDVCQASFPNQAIFNLARDILLSLFLEISECI